MFQTLMVLVLWQQGTEHTYNIISNILSPKWEKQGLASSLYGELPVRRGEREGKLGVHIAMETTYLLFQSHLLYFK
jgi:hypothetical protein